MGFASNNPIEVIQLGTTRIGDVYCPADHRVADRRPLIGYFAACDVTAYVLEHEVEALCSQLGAERHGDYIRVARGGGYVEYGVRDLGELDFHGLIENCDMAGLVDFECQLAFGCIDLIDADTKRPAGSFQAPPKGVTICSLVEGARCVEIIRNRRVDLYANQDCTPEPPRPTRLDFALCSIG